MLAQVYLHGLINDRGTLRRQLEWLLGAPAASTDLDIHALELGCRNRIEPPGCPYEGNHGDTPMHLEGGESSERETSQIVFQLGLGRQELKGELICLVFLIPGSRLRMHDQVPKLMGEGPSHSIRGYSRVDVEHRWTACP